VVAGRKRRKRAKTEKIGKKSNKKSAKNRQKIVFLKDEKVKN